ncbi:hypothetical protein ACOMHN_042142 [Nucella lapillus]
MSEICDKYLHVFDLAVADLYLYQQDLVLEYPNPPGFKLRPLLNSMGQLFNMAEFHQGSVKIYTREVDVLMHIKGSISSDERLRSMMETCYQLACSLVNSGHYEKGEKTHRDIIEGCQKFLEENPDDERMKQLLGQASNSIGVVYVKQRRWEEAIELFDKSMKQHTGQDDKENIASSYINLGMCHMENGDPERGLTDMRKALQMYEELYFGHLPLEVGNLLTNIGLCYRRLDNMEEAEVMYMRSLKVKANAVGWDHDVVAMAYLNLGTLNMHRNDFAKAEEWARKTMTVQEELSIFGYFRLLDKKIDSLIYNSDVGELLQKMFTRLEEDYNGKETNTTLVQEVLCAIELSKHGLLEKELMEMLGIESHDWLPLYFAMEGLLISHAGLLRFGFAEISHAVRAKYLEDEEEKKRMLKKLIGYFDSKLQSIPIWENLLTPLSKRPVEELPWLQLAVGDLEGLSDTLLNIFTLHYMQQYALLDF